MDREALEHTRQRWNALAQAGVEFSRPWLDLDQAAARERVDPKGLARDLRGARVLCLAAGGGQQSAAFALLGASVTVLDLSDEMLGRDRMAAAHYGITVETIRGDAQDLSGLPADAFDVVWQAHSLSFIQDIEALYNGVARVLRPGGRYHLSAWNPLAYAAADRWTGEGYLLREGYREGEEFLEDGLAWNVSSEDGRQLRVEGPREYRHTLTAMLNGLIRRGFVLLDVEEHPTGDPAAEPGSREHFASIAPPSLTLWSELSTTTA